MHISTPCGRISMNKGLLESPCFTLSNGTLHMPIGAQEGRECSILCSQLMHYCTWDSAASSII